MRYYLAPLEGITRYTYRNAVKDHFGEGIDKYYTPFFAPHTKRTMNSKEMADALPANNEGLYLVPQILTNSSEDFLRFEHDMKNMFGYDEVNINLGCPSGTVFSKSRGSGFLRDLEALDEFLYGVYEKKTGKVSVKTRLGITEAEEFYEILEIYNKYPMEELIIHPRVRAEFYKGRPHREIFKHACEHSTNELSWSGDIYCPEDLAGLKEYLGEENLGGENHGGENHGGEKLGGEKHGGLTSVMCGRGMLADPSLIRQLSGNGGPMTREELRAFHDRLIADMTTLFSGPAPTLAKVKELWFYMINTYAESVFEERGITRERSLRKIQKCKSVAEYQAEAESLISIFVHRSAM